MLRKRILHLINSCGSGGAETHLLSLLGGLQDHYDVSLAYLWEKPPDATSLLPQFRQLGLRHIIDLGAVQGGLASAAWRLRQFERQQSFDLVHTHLPKSDLIGAAVAAGRVKRRVVSVHNIEEKLRHPLFLPFYRTALCTADRVIGISGGVGQFLVSLGVPANKIKRIYYGYDPRTPDITQVRTIRAELGAAPDDLLIGAVGRLAAQKGHLYLVEAMASVVRYYPKAKLALVGHDQEMGAALRQRVHELGLDHCIRLTGSRGDIPEVMAALDLMAFPSLWEGFGLVLLEAMAAETPVIGSDIAPVNEVVVAHETGLLVPPTDVSALAEAICSLLGDPDRRRNLGQMGRQRVKEHFSLKRMADETRSVYDELLE